MVEEAENIKSNVVCDALLLDDASRSDTWPYIEIDSRKVTMGHEASVSKVGEDQLFYAMSRGLSEFEANAMIVNGFIEPLVKELPMEYALELNRLVQIQLEGSIGLRLRRQDSIQAHKPGGLMSAPHHTSGRSYGGSREEA